MTNDIVIAYIFLPWVICWHELGLEFESIQPKQILIIVHGDRQISLVLFYLTLSS